MTASRLIHPTLALLVAVLFLASLLIGPAALGLSESLSALFRGEGGPVVLVMQEIRLPRAILGLLIGAALGMSGAAMQGFLRNPLAEPGLIGVSSSAALGAVLALQIIVSLLEFKIVTLGGFVLLPFGIWNKSAFLAERPLGYVVSSGLKVLALAIVVSGARTIFASAPISKASAA